MSDASDRTIPATPRRRRAAEEQGLVPNAGLVAWAVSLVVGFAVLPAWLRAAGVTAVEWFRELLPSACLPAADEIVPPYGLVVLAGGLVVATLASTLAVRALCDRVRFHPARCLPDVRRLGLLRGTARIFSLRSAGRVFEAAAVFAVVAAAAAYSLGRLVAGLGDMIVAEPTASLMLTWRSLWPVIAAAVATALVRWGIARASFERRIRMTPQEYREELRSLEADPKVKLQRHTPRRAVPA